MRRFPSPRNRAAGLADLDQSAMLVETPADGFSMNMNLRYLPERYFPLSLGLLDQIRQHRDSFRMRILTLPYNLTAAIPAFENFDGAQNVLSGTCVWGFSFAALDGTESDFEIQVYDTCSGLAFFSQPVSGNMIRPNGTTGLFPYIVEPRLVTGRPKPALQVNIANKASSAQRCQLAILCSEPCDDQGYGNDRIPSFPWDYSGGTE